LRFFSCKYLNKDSKKKGVAEPFLIFGFKVPFIKDFSDKFSHFTPKPWEQLQNSGSTPKPWEQFQNA